ncbi:LLM class flavin-dependent oxidoreductase [Pseudonocardia sp. RS11V-5]|uniref:LLM class flavin-dependent oxidoreductase n=1 Tax=Pseudonocardia terrae TaxID=2905831 RepID=UPI001E4A45EB|nr:LLM class flavin-dependent oxidoreductase [Pseudonocardia terrae]MCE3555300.1 LLM class flavin-dependent oxidoreductase [Pseudonocardia terrae]
MAERPIVLGVQPCGEGTDPGRYLERMTLTARGVDVLFLVDPAVDPAIDPAVGAAGAAPVQPRLDALASATRVAPGVPGTGLVPQVPVTGADPVALHDAVAALDAASLGRAGWEVTVRDPFAPTPSGELWAEAAEVVEVAHRLRTGGGTGSDVSAGISDGFSGEFVEVRGRIPVPRSPQGEPVVVIRADAPEALPVAARSADVVRIAAGSVREAAMRRLDLEGAAAEAGRDPATLRVLVDVGVGAGEGLHHSGSAGLASLTRELAAAGADGVVFLPARPRGLEKVADDVVPLLRAHRTPLRTLRERFGLPVPTAGLAAAPR